MSDVEALAAACAGGNLDKVEALLAKGAGSVRSGTRGAIRARVRIPRGASPSFRLWARGRTFPTPRAIAISAARPAALARSPLTRSLPISPRHPGVDANAEDAIFGTPLVAAARGGHDHVVAALLRHDAVDADRASQRDTPLTAAASAGHLEVARALVSSGRVDLSLPQSAVACGAGHRVPSDDALTLAAKRGDLPLVDLLLRAGADPDGGREGTCDTPLTAAASAGEPEVLERLLDARATVDGVARWAGRTALVAAAESEAPGSARCAETLLERGADPNFVSAGVVGRRLGYGAVHAAAARMDCAMVKALVDAGADPNRRARNTDTKEIKSRRAAAARALWGAAAAGQRLDNTPLHLAVAAYINEAARRRVQEAKTIGRDDASPDDGGEAEAEAEAAPNAKKSSNVATSSSPDASSAPGAGERRALEVIKTLLECGADHGAFVVDSTPLHMAALGGATEVVDLLMASGADVDARAPNGYATPLEAAARYAADIVASPERDVDDIRAEVREEDERLTSSRWEDTENARRENARRRGTGLHDDDAYDSDDSDSLELPDASGPAKRKKTEASSGNALNVSASAFAHETSSERSSDDSTLDDAAAMAALRDAAGPLRAVRHLATRWNATVTAHALVGACRAGDEDAAETLLERVEKAAPPENNAANPESPEARKARVRAFVSQVARHTTPMHAAAESGSVPVARMLLERGASPDARRPDDDATPLFCAARHGRPGMIAFLFSQGADIEALCKTADRREGHDSVTPLVEAVMSDQAAAAARLIALGADVRAPTSWMPPLLTATLRSNATITRMLLREGADPRCGVGGMTPLGLAVMTRQSELVKALLDWRGGEEAGPGNGDGKNGKEKEKEKEKKKKPPLVLRPRPGEREERRGRRKKPPPTRTPTRTGPQTS